MIAARQPVQRSPRAKLGVVKANGEILHLPRTALVDVLNRGDLVVANDAATLPASLAGGHVPTGAPIEVRLAGRHTLTEAHCFTAIVFGAGDFRTRTEDRPPPPPLTAGDAIVLGSLTARIERVLDHPRCVLIRFEGAAAAIWEGLARSGKPIQYAHLAMPLALWDVWAAIAGPPVSFEPPSAGFALDWRMLARMQAKGIVFATLTHAAGISSTGDAVLDARAGRRIVAVGTTVVRALEHAGRFGDVNAGEGIADQRIGPDTRLHVVDAILSGTHEPGTSHYELLRAFTDDATLERVSEELDARGYLTHEFGDSVLLESRKQVSWARERTAVSPAEESQRSATLEKLIS